MGLTLEQIEDMKQGEFEDLMTCQQITEGTLIPAPRKMTMEEILAR